MIKEAVSHAPVGQQAIADALDVIHTRFEDGPHPERLLGHNSEHTLGVIERANAIADTLYLPTRWRTLVQIAASHHDVVQKWKPLRLDTNAVIRSRMSGINEQQSADEAVTWMKEKSGVPFMDDEYALVQKAIRATIVSWSQSYGTVIQTELHTHSHPVARTVALADLGAAGMNPESFQKECDGFFMEQEIGLMEAIKNMQSSEDIPLLYQELYLKRYRQWMDTQPKFARGRQQLFEKELGNLSQKEKVRMKKLFSHFDISIQNAHIQAQLAHEYTFVQMAAILLDKAEQIEQTRHTQL